MRIPFNRPSRVGHELDYIAQSIEQGHTASGGPFTERVTELLRSEIGAADVLLTTSCTDALEMSAMMLDIEPGDVVIVPSFTFVTTALAFARQGATIRFCDIEPETLGLDPDHLESLVDHRTKAVVPVHYAGVACRIDEILAVARSHEFEVVEDNAHGLFGSIGGRALGSLGRFSTLSFHETKNFICGEGGALVVNDEADVERAHVLLDKGTNRRAFMLGDVDKYSWVDTGSSFGLSDMLAAYLFAQLEERKDVLASRRWNTEFYQRTLGAEAERLGYRLPIVPDEVESAHHMFYVLLPDNASRNAVLEAMREQDVQATFHYVPLHSAIGGKVSTDRDHDCPVTDDIAGRLIRLPYYTHATEAEIARAAEVFLTSVRAVCG